MESVTVSQHVHLLYHTLRSEPKHTRSHDWWCWTRLSSELHPGREKQDGWHIQKVCCQCVSRQALTFKVTAACSSVQAALRPEPGELREDVREWRKKKTDKTYAGDELTLTSLVLTPTPGEQGSCGGINVVETGVKH